MRYVVGGGGGGGGAQCTNLQDVHVLEHIFILRTVKLHKISIDGAASKK